MSDYDDPSDEAPEAPPSPIVFVNAYLVHRCYGGPEEGGWWYDAGEPLASVPVERGDEAAIESWRATLLSKFADRANPRGRGSVIGGPDLEVYVEDHTAAYFPAERPYYE